MNHNLFFQGSGIINEESVDIDDDVSRHTLNIGTAYRYLTPDETKLFGANIFYDRQWPYQHERMSIGLDAKSQYLKFSTNYYSPITDFKDSRIDEDGNQYEERVLEGYDLEAGYSLPLLPNLSVYAKRYQYFRITEDDLVGYEAKAEYLLKNLTLKGSLISENGGRNGYEVALQYSIPLYDLGRRNSAIINLDKKSMHSQIFSKVRRENRLRVEERVKEIPESGVITAVFDNKSVGLSSFEVSGSSIAAEKEIPTNSFIEITNGVGNFGIIKFSNGAIANISASGSSGSVLITFTQSELTIIQTNGGFVQFVSGEKGIKIVNVPGGIVNLLGTDIDVIEDRVTSTSTIQVRSGAIEVVPDKGSEKISGEELDIISLNSLGGKTAKLNGSALDTRRQSTYVNIDKKNPDPDLSENATPFVTIDPSLITNPEKNLDNADIKLTFSKPVVVVGNPIINALFNNSNQDFIYTGFGANQNELIFRKKLSGNLTHYDFEIGDSKDSFNLNGGAIKGQDNDLNAITTFIGSILIISDTTKPTISSSSPANNIAGISTNTQIVFTFSENIVAASGNITIADSTNGTDDRIIPIADSQVDITNNILTITPAVALQANSFYKINIASSIVNDTASNFFTDNSSFPTTFSTDSGDIIAPILSSFVRKTPASAITDADVLIFTATFDEAVINVDAADFDVDSTSTTTITNVTEINSSTYDITVSGGDLASFNGTVALNVDGGQNITDSFGNIFAGAEPVTDEIYTMDNASPILTSSTPADEALQVSRTASIVLVFDEEVSLDGQINLTDGGNKFGISDIRSFTNSTGAILSVDKKTITISLSGDSGNQRKLEYAEDYEITWSAGAITDSAGNAIVALNGNDLNFKTVDLEAGIILSQTVAQGDATFVTSSAKRNTITQSFIMSVDVDIDSAAAGLILECGGSGRGQYVGFGNGLFRVRGGLGNDSLVNLAGNDVVSIEAPFSNIPTEKTTLMVEYVTSVSAQTIRVWFDEMLLPISSIGSINSPTSVSAFAGVGDCSFASASTSVPRYESTSAFDRSVNGSFRFYDNQIIP